jgi:peptide deformylase
MIYQLRFKGDPVLRQPTKAVEAFDEKLFNLINQMFTIMYKYNGIGLAAPQIGIQKQIFTCDVDEPIAICNPKILAYTGDWIEQDEGCLSIPGKTYTVKRNSGIAISGYSYEGQYIEVEATDMHAAVFQHELGHLQGILISDT